MPGSLSLFGDDPLRHWTFANEVCAERLVRRYVHPSGKLAWDWVSQGANHYCDVLTGIFAMASWFRLYDALPHVLDASATKAPPSADLFDPMKNPAIGENAGLAPFDEGYVENSPEPEKKAALPGMQTLEEWRRRKEPAISAKKHAIIKRKAEWRRR